MKAEVQISHRFVEFIPEQLDERTIYVSILHATAAHICPCGCGREVITPLSPTDWTLLFDGQSVSLDPSIGNWSYPCQSHYWIVENRITWSPTWSREDIEAGRIDDRAAKEKYFSGQTAQEPQRKKSNPKSHLFGKRLRSKPKK